MKVRIVIAGFCCSVLLANVSARAGIREDPPALSATEQHLLSPCVVAFERAQVTSAEFPQIATAGKTSLRAPLTRLVRSLPRGSHDSVCVAFVLCFLDYDRATNLDRMLVPYTRWRKGASGIGADIEQLPQALRAIYLHDNDASVARSLLDMHGDGAFAEALAATRVDLFEHHPESLLRMAATSRSRTMNLARDLLYESWDEARALQIKRKLSQIASGKAGRARQAARVCRDYLTKALPKWRTRYGRGS